MFAGSYDKLADPLTKKVVERQDENNSKTNEKYADPLTKKIYKESNKSPFTPQKIKSMKCYEKLNSNNDYEKCLKLKMNNN